MIERDVYVNEDHRTEVIRISCGSVLGIRLNFMDYNFPPNPTFKIYAKPAGRDYAQSPITSGISVSGNSISFSPRSTFFEPGRNDLQVELYSGTSSKLVTLHIPVDADEYLDPTYVGSTPGTVDSLATQAKNAASTASSAASTATTAANTAAAKAEEIEQKLANLPKVSEYQNLVSRVESDLNNKVDKRDGWGLSKNNFTDAEKAKVDAIPDNPQYTDTVYDDTGVQRSIAELYGYTGRNLDVLPLLKISGSIGDGGAEVGSSGSLTYYRSDYIRVANGTNIVYKLRETTAHYTIAFYNDARSFVESASVRGTNSNNPLGAGVYNTWTAPADGYVRISTAITEGTTKCDIVAKSSIDSKVDKEPGKGLSSNDYTDADAAKVATIPENPVYTDTVYDDSPIEDSINELFSYTGRRSNLADRLVFDGYVIGADGNEVAQTSSVGVFGNTGFIPVFAGDRVEYYVRVISGMPAVAFYDRDRVYDPEKSIIGTVNTSFGGTLEIEQDGYIRISTRNIESRKATIERLNDNRETDDVLNRGTEKSPAGMVWTSSADGAHWQNLSATGYMKPDDGIPASDLSTGLQSLVYDVATPEMFGAVGDGATDDTAAVVAAFKSGARVISLRKLYKVMESFAVSVGTITGKIVCGGGTLLSELRDREIRIGNGTTIRDITFDGFTVFAAGSDITFDTVTVIHAFVSAFLIRSRPAWKLHNIRYINCKAVEPVRNGFSIEASTEGGGTDVVVRDVYYENCVATKCGPIGDAIWSTGFCVAELSPSVEGENLSGCSYSVENVTYRNCVAEDCLESGFHIEKSTIIRNINYISCRSSGNGMRKYAVSDKAENPEQLVYSGDNTVSWGCGFMVKNGARYIDCLAYGNFHDVWSNDFEPLNHASGERYAYRYFPKTDITDGSGFNISEIFGADGNVLLDSNKIFKTGYPFLSAVKIHTDSTRVRFNPMDAYERRISVFHAENGALVARNDNGGSYGAGWWNCVSMHPIQITPECGYTLTFDAEAQNSSVSIAAGNNLTLQMAIATYDADMYRIAVRTTAENDLSPGESGSARHFSFTIDDDDDDAFIGLSENARYLCISFYLDSRVSSNTQYDYLAPIISNIKLKWK